METSKQFTGIRCDNFVDVPKVQNNPIQEHWIHKEVVVKTGDSDDEFVIVHKPVCIERIDLDKRIHEEAKGTDLKSLVQQVIRTGDVSLLNQRQGSYVDITGYPDNSIDAMNNLVRGNDLLGTLPAELKDMKLEDLINMSNDDIGSIIKESIGKAINASDPKAKEVNDKEVNDKKEPVKDGE